MFYQLITFTLLATVSSIHRSTHRERASKILYNDDEFVSDRSSTIAAAARGTRSPRSNLISQTDRFLETTTTVINAPTCPRWGNIDAPAGEAPVPRRGGFAFTMRAANGASRLVVGGGERRDGGGAPRILKKLRYLSLGGTKGGKTWVNPSPNVLLGPTKCGAVVLQPCGCQRVLNRMPVIYLSSEVWHRTLLHLPMMHVYYM